MNLDDYSYVENDRRYVEPRVGLNERNAFIDNLRETWPQNTAQIRQDTRNLGTHISSNLGGLGGGSSYFASRYQTPQMNSMISDLRAVAQSTALQELMNNEINKAKKRYQDAYNAAKDRENSNSSGTGGNEIKDFNIATEYTNAGDAERIVPDEENPVTETPIVSYGGYDTYGKEGTWGRKNANLVITDSIGQLIHNAQGLPGEDYQPVLQRLYNFITGFDGTNYGK